MEITFDHTLSILFLPPEPEIFSGQMCCSCNAHVHTVLIVHTVHSRHIAFNCSPKLSIALHCVWNELKPHQSVNIIYEYTAPFHKFNLHQMRTMSSETKFSGGERKVFFWLAHTCSHTQSLAYRQTHTQTNYRNRHTNEIENFWQKP